jgi:phenylalanyl-tRNA synthetase alpha chain
MSLDLDQVVADAQAAFAAANDNATLENEKARFLGKTGALTELLKGLGKLDPEARKTEGARINQAKQQVEAALPARRQALADALMNARLAAEAIDVTLPGRRRAWQPSGDAHLERVEQIFGSIGFDVADGPEIETDWTTSPR